MSLQIYHLSSWGLCLLCRHNFGKNRSSILWEWFQGICWHKYRIIGCPLEKSVVLKNVALFIVYQPLKDISEILYQWKTIKRSTYCKRMLTPIYSNTYILYTQYTTYSTCYFLSFKLWPCTLYTSYRVQF